MDLQEIKDKRDGKIDFSKGAEVCNEKFYSYLGTDDIDWLIAEVEKLQTVIAGRTHHHDNAQVEKVLAAVELEVKTIHLDMGGKHRYAISADGQQRIGMLIKGGVSG